MKLELLINVVFISLLHGLIPGHWVPVMAMKKQYQWTTFFTLKMVSLLSVAHILSTLIIGILFSLLGKILSDAFKIISVHLLSSLVLTLLGAYFIYRHYFHHHFHLYHEEHVRQEKNMRKQLYLLMIGMLFSPCMEITGMFFVGGMMNWYSVFFISIIYFTISFLSSVFWVYAFDALSRKISFHNLEHYGGLLSGLSLIISALLIYFI